MEPADVPLATAANGSFKCHIVKRAVTLDRWIAFAAEIFAYVDWTCTHVQIAANPLVIVKTNGGAERD